MTTLSNITYEELSIDQTGSGVNHRAGDELFTVADRHRTTARACAGTCLTL